MTCGSPTTQSGVLNWAGGTSSPLYIEAGDRSRLQICMDPESSDGPVYGSTQGKAPSAAEFDFVLSPTGILFICWEENPPTNRIILANADAVTAAIGWSSNGPVAD